MHENGQACQRLCAVLLVFAALAPGCRRRPPPERRTAPAAVTSACAEGNQVDPPRQEIRPAIDAFHAQNYEDAQRRLDALIVKYPNSAKVRVWRGDATLFDKALTESQAAERALPIFAEARRLQDAGCRLRDYEEYYLSMGLVYGYLRRDDPKPAIDELQRVRAKWPDNPEVHYHLARAYCQLDQLERCADEFQTCLALAKSLKRPLFLRTHNSLDDWIRRSRTQSEFPALRKLPRYEHIIQAAQAP
jgi:tetratricopeptide (TPR) repeat protein